MSLPEPPPPSPRQPSLIDVPNDESARARAAPSMRMLDGLDDDRDRTTSKKTSKSGVPSGFASTQGASPFAATRADKPLATRTGRAGWMVAVAVALLVLAGLWWWTGQRDAATEPGDAAVRAIAVPTATAAATTPSPATAPAQTKTDASASANAQGAASTGLASPTAATAPVEPARIETVREADVPLSPPLAMARSQSGNVSPSVEASAPATSLATAQPGSSARSGDTNIASRRSSPLSTVAPGPVTASASSVPFTGAVASARSTSTGATSALPHPGAVAPMPTTSAATAVATTTPTRKADPTRPASGDPDVALFDALLSRMAGGAKTDPNALPRPALGDLIERCESRAGRDTPEAAGCRARVCADQWGKAEACPAALAPKPPKKD